MAIDPTPDATLRSSIRENMITRASVLPWVLRLLSIGPILILILLAIIVSILTPNFLRTDKPRQHHRQIAVIATVAIGQHLVILTRGIDLSVGSNLALATVMGGLVFG
jgi:ribose transport system permease protein